MRIFGLNSAPRSSVRRRARMEGQVMSRFGLSKSLIVFAAFTTLAFTPNLGFAQPGGHGGGGGGFHGGGGAGGGSHGGGGFHGGGGGGGFHSAGGGGYRGGGSF